MNPNEIPPTHSVWFRTSINDGDGVLIKKSPWKPSRSFLIAYLELIYTNLANQSKNIEDITNTSRTVSRHQYNLHIEGGASNDALGIVVGTGTTATTDQDYSLETKIAHGTGAGELEYGAQTIGDPSESGGNVDMVLTRIFTNGSGDSITVNECGCYCYGNLTPYTFCILRDIISPGEAVADTEALTCEYTLRTMV